MSCALSLLLVCSVPQAALAESGKKTDADKKAAASKPKTHVHPKNDAAAKEGKPKRDTAPVDATTAQKPSESPTAEPKPAAEPAQATPLPETTASPSPSLAATPQRPPPADKPNPPQATPTGVPPALEPAAAGETNPPVPAGELAPSGAPNVPTPVPIEQATEPVPQSSKPAPAACNRADFRMAIDVGHTETNYGAVSAHGRYEFDFNRRLAHDLADKLWHNGFDRADVVIQTDSDLSRRARDLSSRRPNLMLSLHHDSVQDKYLKTAELDGQMRTFTEGFHGYSIFVSHENAYREDSDRFAKMLGVEMIAQGLKPTFHHHEQENRPILDNQTGVFQYDGLAVLRLTTAPAVLLESAVITNPEDEAKADDPAYRNRITRAIVTAVTKFCDANGARAPQRTAQPASTEKQSGRK